MAQVTFPGPICTVWVEVLALHSWAPSISVSLRVLMSFQLSVVEDVGQDPVELLQCPSVSELRVPTPIPS